tara:strand:+ start:5521 stop:5868 length:348 start_codon:yes stop_codon:yes gene_type:complete
MRSKRIEKPWGYEDIFAHTSYYVGKILFINKGHRLSRQYHEVKDETIYVISGALELQVGRQDNCTVLKLSEGESFHVTPGTVHRFCAPYGDVKLMEVSTPELDDVVRLEDDYGRG